MLPDKLPIKPKYALTVGDEFDSYETAAHLAAALNVENDIKVEVEDVTPCSAEIFTGSGHQSRHGCVHTGPHEVHFAEYHGGEGWFWTDNDYTHYPGNEGWHICSGFFNESPTDEEGYTNDAQDEKATPNKCLKCKYGFVKRDNATNTFACSKCGWTGERLANWRLRELTEGDHLPPEPVNCPGHGDKENCEDNPQDPCRACYEAGEKESVPT